MMTRYLFSYLENRLNRLVVIKITRSLLHLFTHRTTITQLYFINLTFSKSLVTKDHLLNRETATIQAVFLLMVCYMAYLCDLDYFLLIFISNLFIFSLFLKVKVHLLNLLSSSFYYFQSNLKDQKIKVFSNHFPIILWTSQLCCYLLIFFFLHQNIFSFSLIPSYLFHHYLDQLHLILTNFVMYLQVQNHYSEVIFSSLKELIRLHFHRFVSLCLLLNFTCKYRFQFIAILIKLFQG